MTKCLASRLSLSALALTLLAGLMLVGASAPARAQPACSTLVITGHPSYTPVAWAAQGKSAWETGEILGISQRTVEEHLAAATRKLGAGNRTRAVAIAIRDRIIEP